MFPRRYCADGQGRRVLIGLTIEETFEFETLEQGPAIDNDDSLACSIDRGKRANAGKTRWLELYSKHETAWGLWSPVRDINA